MAEAQEAVRSDIVVTSITNGKFDEPAVAVSEDEPIEGEAVEVDEPAEPAAVDDPEAAAAAELERVEAEKAQNLEPKEGDVDGSKVFFKGKWVGKQDFSYRMHLKTAAEKAAKEDATKARESERSTREENAKLARERDELRAKYEPKSDTLGPKPELAQFATVADYEQAFEHWTDNKVRIESENKTKNEKAEKADREIREGWDKRKAAFIDKTPDYAEAIDAVKDLPISDQVGKAIHKSDFGPEIIYHLAKNPDIAKAWAAMDDQGDAVRAMGRLEAAFDKPKASKTIAELSRAPAPITRPLAGRSTAAAVLKGSDDFHGTYDEWKAKFNAGQIQ